jgi:hypothetical protein
MKVGFEMENERKTLTLPPCLEFPTNFKREKVKHELEVLPNWLVICDITIINPFNDKERVSCKALIDTGAEGSILCNSLFNQFKTIDESKKFNYGLSTLNKDSQSFVYPFILEIPTGNWSKNSTCMIIMDLTVREEYDAILGMDILRNFDLIVKGSQKLAYLLE